MCSVTLLPFAGSTRVTSVSVPTGIVTVVLTPSYVVVTVMSPAGVAGAGAGAGGVGRGVRGGGGVPPRRRARGGFVPAVGGHLLPGGAGDLRRCVQRVLRQAAGVRPGEGAGGRHVGAVRAAADQLLDVLDD